MLVSVDLNNTIKIIVFYQYYGKSNSTRTFISVLKQLNSYMNRIPFKDVTHYSISWLPHSHFTLRRNMNFHFPTLWMHFPPAPSPTLPVGWPRTWQQPPRSVLCQTAELLLHISVVLVWHRAETIQCSDIAPLYCRGPYHNGAGMGFMFGVNDPSLLQKDVWCEVSNQCCCSLLPML